MKNLKKSQQTNSEVGLHVYGTESNSSASGFVIDPEGDPREHDDENGGQISLKNEIADVALQPE